MMLWGGRRAPFTLIGGYLGAGKTTVLNHLIRHAGGRRWAVLVNDVGAVNVDASLIAAHDGDTLALTNGCVCCSIADDLGLTLESIRSWAEPPDHVIMELSGVAEPARVAPWASTAGFRLDGIVVVVDAERVADQLADDLVGDAVRAQVTAADLLVVSKCDLAVDGGASATDALRELSTAPAVHARDGVVAPAIVLGLASERHHDADVAATWPAAHRVETLPLGQVSEPELRRIVDELDDDVVRAKGVIRCVDSGAVVEVSVVGPRRRLHRRPDLSGIDTVDELVVIRPPTHRSARRPPADGRHRAR